MFLGLELWSNRPGTLRQLAAKHRHLVSTSFSFASRNRTLPGQRSECLLITDHLLTCFHLLPPRSYLLTVSTPANPATISIYMVVIVAVCFEKSPAIYSHRHGNSIDASSARSSILTCGYAKLSALVCSSLGIHVERSSPRVPSRQP